MRQSGSIRTIALCLVLILALYTISPTAAFAQATESNNIPIGGELAEDVVAEDSTTQFATLSETYEEPYTENSGTPAAALPGVFYNEKICIYNYVQLTLIGTGQPVTDMDYASEEVGTGNAVLKEDDTAAVYSLDAAYCLMQDIEIPDGTVWDFPEDFTGSFSAAEPDEGATPALYDADTDTIYLYNPYQLMLLESEDAAQEPVMTLDYDAARFGMGQLIYPDGEENGYLTYSLEHHYVLSSSFSGEMPEMPAVEAALEAADAMAAEGITEAESISDGRDFAGQVIKTIDGIDYILIGNEEQLRAIGSDDPVYTAVYQTLYVAFEGWQVYTDGNGDPVMLYGGDADLEASQNGNKDYTLGSIDSASGGLLETVGYCGVDQATGEIDTGSSTLISSTLDDYSGHTYSATENYIVFRDIDLSSANWTPLMFSGNMVGAKSEAGEPLWDAGSTAITATGRPVISNVTVNQTDPIDVSDYIGVGFFATITNEINVADIGVSAGTVTISNIELQNVSVTNSANTAKSTQTILNALTSGLGWLVGGLVDLLVTALTFGEVDLNLSETLSALLDARAADPTIFATGTFAGRIVGDVAVDNCAVTGTVVLSSINDRTGGFVGYTEGVAQYDGLSDALGITADALSSLLNVIPGLGLGDLITVLLDNALPVGSLIPTGYINPEITDCSVENITTPVGAATTDYNGGFVGQQVGCIIQNCAVKNSTLTVEATMYGGGFAGLSRDAEIQGVLSEVGIELLRISQPQSLLMDCTLENCAVAVTGGDYLGGFAGALANSYAINDGISGSGVTVTASGSYAGGFSGIATVGWLSNLGRDEVSDVSLLSTVRVLLVGLLSSDPSQAEMLLSLVGVAPSAVLGCQIDGGSVAVTAAGSYAGGFLGRGDGVYLADSSAEYLNELSYWEYDVYPDPAAEDVCGCTLTGLQTVSSGAACAGGIAGSVGTASVGGLLNDTIGLGGFLGFTVRNVTVTGTAGGYSVSAGENYAGGAFGESIGGTVETVTLNGLQSVTANNRAGGFVGCAGPGDLAGTGGLRLSLLGLDLLEANGLLSVAQGLSVEISDSAVNGITAGFTVQATGSNAAGEVVEFIAGGFIGKSNSTQIENAAVNNLLSVTADDTDGNAGGFIGTSTTGGLADVSDETTLEGLINAGSLLTAVGYLIPSYTNCTVTYVDGGGVQADTAGGFAADFQSGTVNNQTRGEDDYYAVYNLDHVDGGCYAGGFGGKVYSGALAAVDDGGGLSILGGLTNVSLNLTDLLSLIDVYVPFIQYAGVKSVNGFTVTADALVDTDSTSGSAGGFIGYGSGVQVSYCDVTSLKYTEVTPPDELEAVDAPSYFDGSSTYAVTGARYAGGYIGDMDIGCAASLSGGLKILGSSIALTDVLSALSVVVSTIEHSNASGSPGGFAVLASGTAADGAVGMAGGFAGNISGGHIQDSNVLSFSYVVGQIAAGGYVGNFEPGNVANVLNDMSLLGGLVDTQEALASLVEDFVPTIRNSSTACIPCGGAARAQAASDTAVQRGMAGGYVGRNEGGHIWGLNTDPWKSADDYTGPTSVCTADRILSVYGMEYTGGFTGLMECADTSATGSLSLLGGLISVDNLLGALSVVYPTEENTAVYGPLANLDYQTWNLWVGFIGIYGGFGAELAASGTVGSQEELDAILARYVYGYHVRAGRSVYETGANVSGGGCAGGYVGAMHGGVITNGQAHDTKQVTAMRSAGGFAGEMLSGGAADFGSVSILGLSLDIGQLLGVVDVFVPVIKSSSTTAYQSGLTVIADGLDLTHGCGYAGGYVGSMFGGQIWGDADEVQSGCNILNLRRVKGTNCVGGYAGFVTAGSVADVNTNAGGDLLQGVLDLLIATPNDLLSVLQATVSTIRCAEVSAADPAWGYVVDGSYQSGGDTLYAKSAGGFAGSLEAAVLGDSDGATMLQVTNLRGVEGGLYAGGFFGLADVASVASVSGNDTSSGVTTILGLIEAGEVSVLDAFRTYIDYADVQGVEEGITIRANTADSEGLLDSTRYTGNAGGFGGGLLNGTVRNSSVSNLSLVSGLNYTGGFIGHLGKNGVVDVDNASVLEQLNLLGATAGVLDVVGSRADHCTVTGIGDGFVVRSTGGEEPIAGGFTGYADLSRVDTCTVNNLKKVTSGQIAGGFAGKTEMNYVANVQVSSALVDVLLQIVDTLVEYLYLDDLENLGLIDIGGGLLGLKVLSDGDVLYVNLLGLKISAALIKAGEEGQTDVAIVTIGDSTIELPCSDQGIDMNAARSEIEITLIKGNRTNLVSSAVNGIAQGYDVYGGGASDTADGNGENGYSGGFIGLNNEGAMEDNTMTYCDVVRGTAGEVGPFTGTTNLQSTYYFNTVASIEGIGNQYSIYRPDNTLLQYALTDDNTFISQMISDTTYATLYNRYDVLHYDVIMEHADLSGAVMASDTSGADAAALSAYVSPAKAVLMADTAAADNPDSLTPEPGESQDPCSQTIDFTIQKIWKDWGDWDDYRPDSITVTIYQTYEIDGTEADRTVYDTITLTASEDGSNWSSTWERVVSGLPVAFEDTGGILRYYRYYVEEAAVDQYLTEITYDDTGYVATITNRHDPELPFTGGGAINLFILGIFISFIGLVWLLWNRKRNQKERTTQK